MSHYLTPLQTEWEGKRERERMRDREKERASKRRCSTLDLLESALCLNIEMLLE